MIYSTRHFVFYVLPCVILFLCFLVLLASLEEERANLSAFRIFVRFALVWFCLFPLPLGVWEGLQFVILALPGFFSYLLFGIGFFISSGSHLHETCITKTYIYNFDPLKPHFYIVNNLCFEKKYEKYQNFYLKTFRFFVENISIYLNRHCFRNARSKPLWCSKNGSMANWSPNKKNTNKTMIDATIDIDSQAPIVK